MEIFSENSKYIDDIKKLTYEADKIIQEHQQLIELDLNLNLNRESLSAIRRGCYNTNNKVNKNKIKTLENIEFSKFETTNKLLKLGDFFISTTPFIINKYLLSEKRATEELMKEVRLNRYKRVENFMKIYPNISETLLNELNFIIKDTYKDKTKYKNNHNHHSKYNHNYINFIPKFKIFDNNQEFNKIDFNSID